MLAFAAFVGIAGAALLAVFIVLCGACSCASAAKKTAVQLCQCTAWLAAFLALAPPFIYMTMRITGWTFRE